MLDGKIGEYVVVARRSGNTWYVGGMTNWTPRTLDINLAALGIAEGTTIDMFCDGKKAAKDGTDYLRKSVTLPADGVVSVELAPGGGVMMKIVK